MPARKFWTYVKMMPVIRARTAVARINEMALAFGSMDKETSSSYIRQLQGSTEITHERAYSQNVIKPSSPEELAALSGGQIQVIME